MCPLIGILRNPEPSSLNAKFITEANAQINKKTIKNCFVKLKIKGSEIKSRVVLQLKTKFQRQLLEFYFHPENLKFLNHFGLL